MSSNTPVNKTKLKQEESPKNVATPFWKKHFLKLFLVVLIIASLAWGWISKSQLQKAHDKEIVELNERQEAKILQLTELKNKDIAQTLALAVRSELIDENKDQVNQYFLQILKQPAVEKLMLVNHDTGKVIISTNKKDEGNAYDKATLLKAKEITTLKKDEQWHTSAPIMGLNNQLAVIVMVTTAD